MKNTPHELADEFPEHADRIHALKTSNTHFARLFDEYHEINREVHRAETDVEPVSDEHMTELRRKRMTLKDELYAMLAQADV